MSNRLTMVAPAALTFDVEAREVAVREAVQDALGERPPPRSEEHVVATYFFALRTRTLAEMARDIVYHATSGTHDVPPGSLLERCTGEVLGVHALDESQRVGLVHMGYPLEMLLQRDGHLTSTDLLHTAAGAVLFDTYETVDSKLVSLELPPRVLATFPGPAYGPAGLRSACRFPEGQPAFGTILKPTAGITPAEVGALVAALAPHPQFLFIKEDENLYPRLPYSPASERTRAAVAAVEGAQERRGDVGLVFAPHITGAPHELLETLHAVLEAGATGVMLSESFAGGAVRMVREETRHLERPPAIYGHNAGIGVRTRAIWREVIDRLARLDGIDFRQTAPVRPGAPFIKPYGDEWRASERALTEPLGAARPVMIARAGALDQGNLGLNLAETDAAGTTSGYLFLAGSAINAVKNDRGEVDVALGVRSMQEAVEVHRSGVLDGVPGEDYARELLRCARGRGLHALAGALVQRYPELA